MELELELDLGIGMGNLSVERYSSAVFCLLGPYLPFLFLRFNSVCLFN